MAIFDPPSGHQDTAATGLLYGTKKERQFRIFPLGGIYRKVAKGHLFLFNHFIDMRTTVSLSISCGKNVFLLENFN